MKTITFRNPDGQDVTTLRTGQYQWSCSVPVRQDGKVWSFARGLDANNTVRIGFENCPRVLAWSAEQLLVPRELLSVYVERPTEKIQSQILAKAAME